MRFIHRTPELFNLGDLLCSPRHYFRFAPGRHQLTVVGGGAFNDFGAEELSRRGIDPPAAVLWGVGASWADGSAPRKVEHLPYAAWGLRDRDRVTEDRFLPCASCMHEMLDLSVEGNDTLIFLNRDPKVTPAAQQAELVEKAEHLRCVLMFNDASEGEFVRVWRRARFVVTNSYHGAYWSLLSGRSVACLGHSSKFASLYAALNLSSEGLIRYERRDPKSFSEALCAVLARQDFVRLPDASDTLRGFRAKNLAFAASIARAGLIDGWQIRSHHLAEWKKRDLEGRLWPSLRHFARRVVRGA